MSMLLIYWKMYWEKNFIKGLQILNINGHQIMKLLSVMKTNWNNFSTGKHCYEKWLLLVSLLQLILKKLLYLKHKAKHFWDKKCNIVFCRLYFLIWLKHPSLWMTHPSQLDIEWTAMGKKEEKVYQRIKLS